MIDLFISIFGEYEPLTDSVTGEVLDGLASINFTYIGSVIVFLMFLAFTLQVFKIFLKGVLNVK